MLLPCFALAQAQPDGRLLLREDWAIQSSRLVHDSGAAISTPEFRARDWYPATLPSTVFSALVKDRVFPDPYSGMNLRNVPGVNYTISENFSNIAMPPGSPFQVSWWFRGEFKLPEDYAGKTVWLHFDGINYRANVWLNGRQVAASDNMAGAWRLFEYDVTQFAKPGRANALAIEVFPPAPEDLAVTFVDWNPQPPDKGMGLWRDVYLTTSGPAALRFPNVVSTLTAAGADLTVTAEVKNAHKRALKGVLRGKIEQIAFEQPVRLAAGESTVVRFAPDKFPQLKIANPRLWWPAQVGPQDLYTADLDLEVDGKTSDHSSTRFGIRQVTAAIDENNHLLFKINGKNILIRGAGYTFDMLLRSSPERQKAELNYVRDMNLNTVRLEGKLENDHFFDLADEMGILVLAGWCCCDAWEHWPEWQEEQHAISAQSLRDQIRRLRTHPSVFDWMNGSDNPPPEPVESRYIGILKELDWPNPYQSSATAKPAASGPTGVKMTGPYQYVSPSYWLLDKTRGGAHGFNTETSPGPAVPPVESLRQMLPADHLWPIDSYWNYHTGGGPFKDLSVFTEALGARYGAATGVEDYARKAQAMAYEGHRAMFEAFGRNKYTSTGVIQWMLNNAWPSMIWHLYDWYLRPGGSYFGAKKACEPLHVQYSYDDGSVVVVNSFYQAFSGMKVTAKVYDLDMAEKFSKEAPVDAGPDSVARAFSIPADIAGLSGAYFIQLRLDDAAGKPVSSNFYWLSTKREELDWNVSTWYHTPTKTFSDMTALAGLPAVELKATAASEVQGQDGVTRVVVENPSRTLAFQVHLRAMRGDTEILPVLWEDNYFSLLPGEKRQVTATYGIPAATGPRAAPTVPVSVEMDGWNVKPARF